MSSSPTAPRPRRCELSVERLETRELLAVFQPTAVEQLFLEQLNDARANPAAYGQSIGFNLSGVAPSQPLAFNPQLIQAARLQAQDMAARSYFDHFTPEGLDPGDRITAAGFSWSSYGESIAGGSAFPGPADALRGLIIDSGVPDLGHRVHLLAIDNVFKTQSQIGIGVVQNTNGPLTNYYVLDTARGFDTRPLLTGVIFRDGNGNGRYDVGEGLGGVAITVAGVGSVTNFDTGGYSVQLSPGTYTVTASGGGLATPVTQTVTLGSSNLRVNFIPPIYDPRNDDTIRKLYVSVLGRQAADQEVVIWRPVIQSQGQGVVANAIERSPEARTRLVRSWYVTYLGRQAGNGEEQSWVYSMVAGATEEQALGGIVSSTEYFNRSGSLFAGNNGNESFVQGLFQQFLKRTAGASEVANFVQNILPVLGRGGASRIVLLSPEFRGTMVRSYYADLLHRGTLPSAGEVNGWVASGLDLTSIRVGFEGSQEYFVNG